MELQGLQTYSSIWPFVGKYGHTWLWFRSHSCSKAIIFNIFLQKKHVEIWKEAYMATLACAKRPGAYLCT